MFARWLNKAIDAVVDWFTDMSAPSALILALVVMCLLIWFVFQ